MQTAFERMKLADRLTDTAIYLRKKALALSDLADHYMIMAKQIREAEQAEQEVQHEPSA